MNPAYTKKLGLRIQKTDVGAQKINGCSLDTFGMAIASFQVQDKLGRARFFQETFLVTDIRMDVVLKMPFLTLSNANIQFAEENLIWKNYSTNEVLPTTKWVQIINRKEFIKAALNPNKEVFVVHVATITSEMAISLAHKARISLLKAEEAPVTVPAEYSDFANVFSEKLARVLPEHIEINTYSIDLEEGKQPLYESIYSLGLMELKTLKTYIKTNLANGFICLSKSSAGTPILFD